MTKRTITPIAMAIHLPDESPIFGDSTLHLALDDEGAGPFFVLRQVSGNDGNPLEAGSVRIDMEELEAFAEAARRLISGHP